MSWIDDIKLVRWFNNGVALLQTQGVNLIGLGATAVDNPNYQTTLPDGSIAQGRTEISVPCPNQPFTWEVATPPSVAAERWLSNYGAWQGGQHGKTFARRFIIYAIRWKSQGFTPAQSMTLQLYHNGATMGAAWSMVIPGGAGPNYEQELRPSVPFVTGNGCIIGLSATQAGTGLSAGMKAIITVN